MQYQDLLELARVTLQGIREGKFVLGFNVEDMGKRLMQRAEAIGRGELPREQASLM
jgi:hypothetical protein